MSRIFMDFFGIYLNLHFSRNAWRTHGQTTESAIIKLSRSFTFLFFYCGSGLVSELNNTKYLSLELLDTHVVMYCAMRTYPWAECWVSQWFGAWYTSEGFGSDAEWSSWWWSSSPPPWEWPWWEPPCWNTKIPIRFTMNPITERKIEENERNVLNNSYKALGGGLWVEILTVWHANGPINIVVTRVHANKESTSSDSLIG